MKRELLLPAAIVLVALGVLVFVIAGPGPKTVDVASSDLPAPTEVAGSHHSFAEGGNQPQGVAANNVSSSPQSPAVSSAQVAPNTSTESPKEVVLATIDDAIVMYSPAAVGMIAPHVSSKDPQIRDAAIEGLKQLGEPDGAKLLRRLAQSATDPRDRRELLDAAEFIELPPVQLEDIQP